MDGNASPVDEEAIKKLWARVQIDRKIQERAKKRVYRKIEAPDCSREYLIASEMNPWRTLRKILELVQRFLL